MFTVNVSVLFFRIFEFFWVFIFNVTNTTCCWAWLFMKFEECPPGIGKSECNCHHLHLEPFSDEKCRRGFMCPRNARSAASACIDRLDSELSAWYRRQLPCMFSRKYFPWIRRLSDCFYIQWKLGQTFVLFYLLSGTQLSSWETSQLDYLYLYLGLRKHHVLIRKLFLFCFFSLERLEYWPRLVWGYLFIFPHQTLGFSANSNLPHLCHQVCSSRDMPSTEWELD